MPCVLSWPMPTLKDTVYHSNGHHALYAWLKGAQPAYMRLIRRHLQPSVKGSLRVRRAGSRDLSGLNQARACSVPAKGSLAAASPPLTADHPCPKKKLGRPRVDEVSSYEGRNGPKSCLGRWHKTRKAVGFPRSGRRTRKRRGLPRKPPYALTFGETLST